MANILYLVHRLPYPPNKGDKVRSYHLLKHLARKHRVFLGTFVDDPDDEVHVATVRALCADLHVSRLRPRLARVASLNALLSGDPLTLRYYRSAAMADWVKQTCSSTHIDAAVIFSSAMAQYVEDFRRVRVEAMCNGVDADYFSSDPSRPSPYKADELPVVFTGAMDYLPNVDAVAWFKHEVLPDVLKRWPDARFYIVGRSPTAAVLALASDQVVVTGTVPDVRPYLQHAAAVVAPLRIARGIQNKILEAMSMAKPVIASVECAAAVDAAKDTELLTAGNPAAYIAELGRVLDAPAAAAAIGRAARQRVVERYSWEAHLEAIDRYLPRTRALPQ